MPVWEWWSLFPWRSGRAFSRVPLGCSSSTSRLPSHCTVHTTTTTIRMQMKIYSFYFLHTLLRWGAADPTVPLVALLAPAHRLVLHHRAHGVGAARHAGARVHAFIAENTHFYNQDPKISQISCLTQAWWLGQSLFWAHSLQLGGVPR